MAEIFYQKAHPKQVCLQADKILYALKIEADKISRPIQLIKRRHKKVKSHTNSQMSSQKMTKQQNTWPLNKEINYNKMLL